MATQLHVPSRPLALLPPAMPPELPPVPLGRQARVVARGRFARGRGRPFLMYGQGRLGSTLLGTLLASHPEVGFGNEVLRAPVRAPASFLKGLRATASAPHYGCHVKPYHLTDFQRVDDPGRWLRRRHDEGWLVLHLQRRNTLLHVLSNMTRNQMATSHLRAGDGHEVPRFTVDTDELLTWMARRARGVEDERRQLSGLPVVEVVYEDDLLPGPEAWTRITGRVFAELGVEPCAVGSALRKIVPTRLDDFVENADAVRRAVAATPWADCLDDVV